MELNNIFLDKYFGNKDITAAAELADVISEKSFTLRDIGDISNRVLHNWIKESLVPGFKIIPQNDSQNEMELLTRKWHRFSFLDYVWLRILIELRKFDVSLAIIKKAESNVFKNIELHKFIELYKGNIDQIEKLIPADERDEFHAWLESPEKDIEVAKMHSRLNFLFFLLADVIIHKEAISLIIDSTGRVHPYSISYFEKLSDNGEYQQALTGHHISISLSKIVSEFISKSKELSNEVLRLKLLTEQEIKIINLIRTEKLNELKIRYNENSKPEMVELTSYNKASTETKIIDMIFQKGYHSIAIETSGGKVVHCRNTRKIKI
jgi:hypothetical protein